MGNCQCGCGCSDRKQDDENFSTAGKVRGNLGAAPGERPELMLRAKPKLSPQEEYEARVAAIMKKTQA